jgi:5'-phosphate synthase pdxT subunit
MLKIGVLAVQGDVSEHASAVEKTLKKLNLNGKIVEVKTAGQVKEIDALIIPGGESTAIGKLMAKTGVDKAIKEISGKIPVMGICAGMVLISGEVRSGINEQPLLNLMNIKVNRNAFGRQKESFEAKISSKIGIIHGVFIRAPVVESVGKEVEVLAEYREKIVMARQGKLLALSFHPELTCDTKVYEYFLKLIGI